MPPPPWFFRAMAAIPKATGLLSFIGSALILQDVLRSAVRRKRVYSRLMVGMATMDGIWGVVCFLSTWPLPPEYLPPLYGARGTIQTCVAAGFFGIASSLSSILYSGGLTLFFFLVIRCGWREEKIAQRWEKWIHAVPLAVGWGVGAACVALDLISPTAWMCWIQHYPYDCVESHTVQENTAQDENTANCTRGDNAGIYRWAFMFGWVWLVWAFNAVAMAMIYHSIVQKEDASSKHSFKFTGTGRNPINRGPSKNSNSIDIDPPARAHSQSQVRSISMQSCTGTTTSTKQRNEHEDEAQEEGAEPSATVAPPAVAGASTGTGNGTGDDLVDNGDDTCNTCTGLAAECSACTADTNQQQKYKQSSSTRRSLVSSLSTSTKTRLHGSLSRIRHSIHIGRSRSVLSDSGVVSRKNSSKFAVQAFLYSLFFFLTWIVPTVQASLQSFSRKYFWQMMICTVVFMPLQGCFNAMVYFRPRIAHRFRDRRRGRQRRSADQEDSQRSWNCFCRRQSKGKTSEDGSVDEQHQSVPSALAKSITIDTSPQLQQQPQISEVDGSAAGADGRHDGDGFCSSIYLE